jgi:hypothetical protein
MTQSHVPVRGLHAPTWELHSPTRAPHTQLLLCLYQYCCLLVFFFFYFVFCSFFVICLNKNCSYPLDVNVKSFLAFELRIMNFGMWFFAYRPRNMSYLCIKLSLFGINLLLQLNMSYGLTDIDVINRS